MRAPLVLATAAVATLATLNACSSDIALSPAPEPTFSAQTGEEGVLVVDNDGADCPQADFTSIQAAVLVAQPGDKILVCRGVYPENVLVETADLRIEAQAAPGEVVLQGPAARPYGFHLRNTTGVLLQGFRVQGYADANIIIEGGSGNTLRKNVATAGAVDGIELLNSDANVIDQNISFANNGPRSDGMFVWQDSDDNIIRHNEVFNNRLNGINLNSAGSGNIVFGNRTYGNVQRGIQNLNSHENVYENNHSFDNATGMLIAANSRDVTVRNNRVENNKFNGIQVALGANNNLVEKNEIVENDGNGIFVNNNADDNTIQLNHVRESGVDGIRVNDAASGGNTIERNVLRENVEHDAHDNSAGPGTGGTANFWINNKCETENRPRLCEHKAGGPAKS